MASAMRHEALVRRFEISGWAEVSCAKCPRKLSWYLRKSKVFYESRFDTCFETLFLNELEKPKL